MQSTCLAPWAKRAGNTEAKCNHVLKQVCLWFAYIFSLDVLSVPQSRLTHGSRGHEWREPKCGGGDSITQQRKLFMNEAGGRRTWSLRGEWQLISARLISACPSTPLLSVLAICVHLLLYSLWWTCLRKCVIEWLSDSFLVVLGNMFVFIDLVTLGCVSEGFFLFVCLVVFFNLKQTVQPFVCTWASLLLWLMPQSLSMLLLTYDIISP